MRPRYLVPFIYILFLMLPIYRLLNMSFKTTNEILGQFTLWPRKFTFDNYAKSLHRPTWYWGYINSLIYVLINTALSVSVALPAAYDFHATISSVTSIYSSGFCPTEWLRRRFSRCHSFSSIRP